MVFRALAVCQGREGPAQVDQVAIALLPVAQSLELVDQFGEFVIEGVCHGSALRVDPRRLRDRAYLGAAAARLNPGWRD
jgi:hypothetical protein